MDWSTVITIGVVVVVFVILFMVFKWILRLLVVAAFLFIAFVTNPPLEKHIYAVEAKAEREGFKFREGNIQVDDYLIFSLTRAERGDDSRVIGAGAFTQVVIFARP
jgi:hypothetical protein